MKGSNKHGEQNQKCSVENKLNRRKALFEKKRKLSKCGNMSHFIRKCVLEKEIYQVDLEPFRDLQGLLSNATNNINQIAKRVNSTGIIYKEDINDIKKRLNISQKSYGKFIRCCSTGLREVISFYGYYENTSNKIDS